MTLNGTPRRVTTISPTPPSTPRLRMQPTGSRRTLLDGGWWPRSTDPVAELPGLILVIDRLHGPITRLVLSSAGWTDHPRRLGVAGRLLRFGYFTSQPASLLTALIEDSDRVDLLVVPPGTAKRTADAALAMAASSDNRVHAQDILHTVGIPAPAGADHAAQDSWEGEGGDLTAAPRVP
ncbi:DUF5994 family protein [Micromonospora sp. KC723]|uniref:DUF5994 family protein n=1 Tax=Micromonospora sp. KC723 TaxID=2530381 RepID=UPI00140538BD|nr:DUF5994 family protein [Micromonospora sp. KC723]